MTRDEDLQGEDAQLREVARRLGARPAERLDVERAAAAVVQRLREQPRANRVWSTPAVWLRAAAAIALMVGAGAVYRATRGDRRPCPATICATDEGVSLSPEQLRAVLQSLDQEVPGELTPVSTQETGLEDLNATQLQELLHSLEG